MGVMLLPAEPTSDDVAALAGAHPGWFGLADLADAWVTARELGRGESYVAWLAAAHGTGQSGDPGGRREVVIRVPRRPVAELPRPLAAQVAALRIAPPGIGPTPIAVREPDAADPTAYLVESLVPGEVLPPERWTQQVIDAHARQLARLHHERFDRHGVVGDRGLAARLSIVEEGENAWDWWRTHRPEIAGEAEVGELWPAVRGLFAAAESEFARLEVFSLIHGDPCVPNILVAGGVPRLVDWEWAMIGDPARDLAFLGGEVWAPPWYLPLTPREVRRQVTAYASASEHAEDVDALLVRREAWLVMETFFVTLHFRRLLADGTAEGQDYRTAVGQLTQGLRQLLG